MTRKFTGPEQQHVVRAIKLLWELYVDMPECFTDDEEQTLLVAMEVIDEDTDLRY